MRMADRLNEEINELKREQVSLIEGDNTIRSSKKYLQSNSSKLNSKILEERN